MTLLCPVCGAPLARQDRSYVCPTGHRFDRARQGYVNLLPVQQKHSLHPGDTREQVLSRRAFLETGSYGPIVEALTRTALRYHPGGDVLDVGCGEGYYATRVAGALGASLTGLDISKEAVRCAAAKYKGPTWVCGTAAHLPIPDNAVGCLMSLFALTVPGEFHRVLRPDGVFLQVLAAQDHLMALKEIIYPQILLKEKDSVPALPGFALVESIPIAFPFTVEGEHIRDLLSMTPHFWRISAQGAQRLQAAQTLTDRASCMLNVYRPV